MINKFMKPFGFLTVDMQFIVTKCLQTLVQLSVILGVKTHIKTISHTVIRRVMSPGWMLTCLNSPAGRPEEILWLHLQSVTHSQIHCLYLQKADVAPANFLDIPIK